MNSSREGEKLSRRLLTLASYHDNQNIIWDIGCDHGLLGLSFRSHSAVEEIHLVDPSKPVIDELHKKLKDSYISKPALFIHHEAGQSLTLPRKKKNLILIAGMGGKEIGEIVSSLYSQVNSESLFVISPHRKILELRILLSELPVSLLKEEVIFEDGQFYQVLALKVGPGKKVGPYGEELWNSETGKAYRDHQIRFFTPHRDVASSEYVAFLKSLTP